MAIKKPYIHPRLQKFFDENENVISILFRILKSVKKNATDSYFFTENNPPPHPRYKYTDKLCLACIYFIIKYGSTWESFLGPISGKQLNKKHHQYLKLDIYSKFFNESLKKYLEKNDIKYLSMDATILTNKNCVELEKSNPRNRNKKGIKLNVIIDEKMAPLHLSINESTINESKIAQTDVTNMVNKTAIKKAINKLANDPYLLADSGYDSSYIADKLKKANIKPILYPRNRNCKNPKKMRYLNKKQKKIYKKRIVVENFFAIIKKYPKINCVYEKLKSSFEGLVLFLFSAILVKKYITR